MRKVLKLCLLLMLVSVMASCSTEQRAMRQMRSLTTSIEKHGDNYSIDDWQTAYYQFKEIDERIDNSKLTPKQQKEYTELQGRCVKSFAKSSVKAVKEGIATYVKEGIGIVKEIIDAVLE